LVAAQP